MAGRRKVHTAAFKAQVALAALKGDRTVNELAGYYGVHPTLIHGWKKRLLTGAEGLFGSPAQAVSADAEARQAELFEQIGRLKMELEQGQRSLKCCSGKDFHQEVIAPSATTPFHGEAFTARMLLQERERKAIEPGKVLSQVLLPDA